jgi:hypothetical protein
MPAPHQPPAITISAARAPLSGASPAPERPVASRPDAIVLSYLRALEGLLRTRGDNDETTDGRLATAPHGHAAQGPNRSSLGSGHRRVPQAPA